MKVFKVEIRETLLRIENIEAENKQDAYYIAEDMYENSEIILYPEDYAGVVFKVLDEESEKNN